MIFQNNQLAFRVIDVLHISQSNIRKENSNRHFCALSFRERSDARIQVGNKTLAMQAGSVTFFPADVDYLREASVDEMTVFHLELFNYSSQEIETFVTAHPQEIGELFRAAYEEWMKNRPDRQYRVTAMLYQLFAGLYEEYARQAGKYSPLVEGAVQYIAGHFAQPGLTVAQIARQVGVCEVYLRRLFQQELHLSPKRYITSLRLQYAVSLLSSGYYTVGEVAKKTGFEDEKYFAVAFKRATGCSPSRYVYAFVE